MIKLTILKRCMIYKLKYDLQRNTVGLDWKIGTSTLNNANYINFIDAKSIFCRALAYFLKLKK